jgi:peptidoglycan/LPS O-acetylase OafA/YrhL
LSESDGGLELKHTSSATPISWESLALLRFFLAWIVLSGHLTSFTDQKGWPDIFALFDGKAAVIGFLLVSGYSIGASLNRESDGFYRRRFLRIYPLYFSAVVFSVALEAWMGGHVRLPEVRLDSLGWLTAAGNLLFLQTFVVKPVALDQAVWSLAIEVFYYALAPLFARMGRNSLLAIISISFVCYALPKHSDWGLGYLVLSKFNAANYAWCWLIGFLLWRDRSPLIIAFALVGVPQMIFGNNTPGPLAVATFILTLMLLIFADKITMPTRLKFLATYLGDLSYPLYLFHIPAMIMGYSIIGLRSRYALVLLALTTTISAFHLIDRFIKTKYLVPLLFNVPIRNKPPQLSEPIAVRVES